MAVLALFSLPVLPLLQRDAEAAIVSGTVFLDSDGDGLLDAGESGVANVVVSDQQTFVRTDSEGHYSFNVTHPEQIVWARTPSGLWPPAGREQAFWAKVSGAQSGVDFPLVTVPDLGADTIDVVQVTDLHIGQASAADNAHSLSFTAALPVAVDLVVATGDLAQGAKEDELLAYRDMMNASGLRYRSVPGNHDWYDGGVKYRLVLGPPRYSFDAGGRHFVVLNSQDQGGDFAFLDRDLASVAPTTPIVTLHHGPPTLVQRTQLADRSVSLIIAGHWHTNRTDEVGDVPLIMTAPLAFGGLDFSPPGFRRIAFGPSGVASTSFFPVSDVPRAMVQFPPEGAKIPAGNVRLVASVYGFLSANPNVTLSVDNGPPVALAQTSSWTRSLTVMMTPGLHHADLVVEANGERLTERRNFETLDMATQRLPMTSASWPQFQGGPSRLGRATALMPPLREAWAYPTGAAIGMASPVVWEGRVYQALTDLEGDNSGVVCLDGATGALLWFARTPKSVRNGVAVEAGVVVAVSEEGSIIGFNAMTGVEKWRHSLNGGDQGAYAYQTPLIQDGKVYVGIPLDFVALNLQDGQVVWRATPQPAASWLGAYLSPAYDATNNVVLAGFARAEAGLFSYSATNGARRPGSGLMIEGSTGTPAVDQGRAYLALGEGVLIEYDVALDTERWRKQIVSGGHIWSYSLVTSPAVGDDRIIIGTSTGNVVAVKRDGRSILWTTPLGAALSDVIPFGDGPQVAGSPVLSGDVVYIGGVDGKLYALASSDGRVLWSQFLGAPTLATPAISGNALFIGSIDGTVHAFTIALPGEVGDGGVTPPPPPKVGGGGCTLTIGGASGRPDESGLRAFYALCLAAVILAARRFRKAG